VFTEPLHNNGSYSIVPCVFVAEGICLPHRTSIVTSLFSGVTSQYLARIGIKNKNFHAKTEIPCSEALEIPALINAEHDNINEINFSGNIFTLQGKYP
jgi:hypothetical protein